MKTLLVAINAKFSHTNLAVRYLKNALDAAGIPAEIAEYTINQPAREILADLVRRRPARLLFSCYIWNIMLVRRLGEELRLLLPDAPLLLGGPEVSFSPEEQLAAAPWADGIFCGEGEELVPETLQKNPAPSGIFRPRRQVPLAELPFAYFDLPSLQNRVIYYESTRGCPFGCAYCLSSADRQVRTRPLPMVFDDLKRLLDARVMQVKFVDRTFNLLPERAYAIWDYLIANDNGSTSFQMELGGDLTTPEQLDLLKKARPGLLQFEIGVQSTSEKALVCAARAVDFARLCENVSAVRRMGNIHQHLDLIAGLPMEGFERFGQSYDEVFALHPEQLQLGFLKLLRGASLYEKREQYGLVHSPTPPYEVLFTPWISFEELTRLKLVEEMTEVYHNSGRFTAQLAALWEVCPSPFEAFLALGERMPPRAVGKYEYYDLLFDFAVARGCDPERLSWLMRYDLCLHERPRRLPGRCAPEHPARRALAKRFPQAHAEVFAYDPLDPACPKRETALLFADGAAAYAP